MYILSHAIPSHKRDLRSLDYYKHLLVTGGCDSILNFYTYQNGGLVCLASSDVCQGDILSVRINKISQAMEVRVLAGCANGRIYAFDVDNNPIRIFQHNQRISSIDFINEDHFVTGSWDGKAIVWQISENKKVCQYAEHKYAVAVYYDCVTQSIVSGSQDKALNLWSWRDGSKHRRVQNAHNDIIRQIVKVQEIGFMTCSNDETLKLWNGDLELLQTFSGHQGFVFSVKCFSLGSYCSGGNDKAIKVWQHDMCKQNIPVPGEVWSIAVNLEGNIIVGCSDGYLRIFTQDLNQIASEQTNRIFEEQMMASASKRSGMKAEDILNLPLVAQSKTIIGKKAGEVKVFRNGQIPEAHMWQNGRWEKVGDVLVEPGQEISTEQKQYTGDRFFPAGFYDFIFYIEDSTGIPKQIPFNAGGNALQAAQLYCKREEISKGNMEQIRKFLMQKTKNVPVRQKNQMKSNEQNQCTLINTPCTARIQFIDIKNPQALFNKLKQFNERAEQKKLNQRQLPLIERLARCLEASNTYHTWKLDFKEMDALKKVLSWPKDIKTPVWDLLRAFLKHYQSEELFSGLEGGREICVGLAHGLEIEQPQPIYSLILKTLSNFFLQNTNTIAFIKHSDIIVNSIRKLSTNRNLKSSNFNYAFVSLLFNFSIGIIEKEFTNMELLKNIGLIIHQKLQCIEDRENRGLLLQAAANILFKYKIEIRESYEPLLRHIQNDDASRDISLLLK